MSEGYYRIGVAAKMLGISPYHLRRLCKAGLGRARMTHSGQWQILRSEIDELRLKGVPDVPQGLLDEKVDLSAKDDCEPEDQDPVGGGRGAETSAEVAESSHQIVLAPAVSER